MKKTLKNTLLLAVLGLSAAGSSFAASEVDSVSSRVSAAIIATPENVLKIVRAQVLANPVSAPEVVSAAIIAADADEALVAKIINVAIMATDVDNAMVVAISRAADLASKAEVRLVAGVSVVDSSSGKRVVDSSSGKETVGPGNASDTGAGYGAGEAANPLNFPVGDSVRTVLVNGSGGAVSVTLPSNSYGLFVLSGLGSNGLFGVGPLGGYASGTVVTVIPPVSGN